jgi:hypothetical protein
MSASNVQSELYVADWQLDFTYREPSRSFAAHRSVPNSGIDDPVNDTGRGLRRGDLQPSDEFACLVKVICEGSGEFL